MPYRASKPPAARNAERRTTAPQATNPSTPGPADAGGRGLAAIAAQTGSSRSPAPASTRAATSPRRGGAPEPQARVAVQQLDRARQRAGGPPRVVVGERDVFGVQRPHAHGPRP